MGDYGTTFEDQIRRNNEEELMRRVIQEATMGLRRFGPVEPLPVAPDELGPPGDSSGLWGTSGGGSWELASAKKTRKRRRKAIGLMA